MLKDKEVISDPQAQYDIATAIHLQTHGGINKTTAVIATKYHWVRIKETVSHVIKNCPECKDTNKPPILRGDGTRPARSKTLEGQTAPADIPIPLTPVKQEAGGEREILPQPASDTNNLPPPVSHDQQNGHKMPLSNHISEQDLQDDIQSGQISLDMTRQEMSDDDFKHDPIDDPIDDPLAEHISADDYHAIQQQIMSQNHNVLSNPDAEMLSYEDMAIDPQIMEHLQAQMVAGTFESQDAAFAMPPPSHHSMQHFNEDSRSHIQQHPEIHSNPSVHTQFADPNQIQQANLNHDPRNYSQHQSPTDFSNPGSQYMSPTQGPHSMMSHPVPDDHIMSGQLDDTGGGVHNMQQMRHVLNMEYMNAATDANGRFAGQQRQ